MLLEQTKQHILALSDQELIEYTQAVAGTFTPEVVAFACTELQRRNLDPAQVNDVAEQTAFRIASEAVQQHASAEKPLGTTGRIFSFVAGMFGVPLLPLLVAWLRFRERGEHRKNRQMWAFAFAGLGTIVLLFLIDAFFHR